MPDYSIGFVSVHQIAAHETAMSRHQFILPEHLFAAITKLEDFTEDAVLRGLGLTSETIPVYRTEVAQVLALFMRVKLNPRQVRRALRKLMGDGGYERIYEDEPISRSTESRAAFARAADLAEEAGAPYTAVQYLLVALLEIRDSRIHEVLASFGVSVEDLRSAACALPAPSPRAEEQVETPTLDQYGVDLTAQAREGALSPTIGRRDEMMQVIRTLARDSKNNPVLVGEAGVGKTAIVEGIAVRIATGNIHPDFHDKRIIQINAADLVAGTTYRGEFEERMNKVIDEAGRAADVILFIDEIHMLMGAGKAEGGMNAANILKPALSRGKIKLIGTTTHSEYRQHIEKDPAMERRLQPIRVEEPSEDETQEILRGIRGRLQDHHGVEIADEAIEGAIRLSVRYMPNRRLPDKARDLLDEACARARYGTALSYSPWMAQTGQTAGSPVGVEHIQQVVAEKIGVPVGQLTEDEAQRILRMPEALRQRVIGQDAAVEAVARVVQRNYANLRSAKQPVGVFLFVGPSGVGKTELTKATAEFLFGSDERMIRLDMSEYMEEHSVSRLIGSPPGYIGHEEGGQLTGALRDTPYAVVLLDEVEKAHPRVLGVFLQVFDDGRLTDGRGRTIDASNAIFMLTSNLGHSGALGFQPGEPGRVAIESAIQQHFRPEFINRIDETVYFQPLQPEHMEHIVRKRLAQLQGTLAERNITLAVADDAVQWLAERGYDPRMGARPLIRLIDSQLTDRIGGMILAGNIGDQSTVSVHLESQSLRITVESDEG